MLLDRVAAGATVKFNEVVLPTQLVIRRSSGDALGYPRPAAQLTTSHV
jgi:hypothetical protein